MTYHAYQFILEMARPCCWAQCRAGMCKREGECCAPGLYAVGLAFEVSKIAKQLGQSLGG